MRIILDGLMGCTLTLERLEWTEEGDLRPVLEGVAKKHAAASAIDKLTAMMTATLNNGTKH